MMLKGAVVMLDIVEVMTPIWALMRNHRIFLGGMQGGAFVCLIHMEYKSLC